LQVQTLSKADTTPRGTRNTPSNELNEERGGEKEEHRNFPDSRAVLLLNVSPRGVWDGCRCQGGSVGISGGGSLYMLGGCAHMAQAGCRTKRVIVHVALESRLIAKMSSTSMKGHAPRRIPRTSAVSSKASPGGHGASTFG
jgi:hypothetical protein